MSEEKNKPAKQFRSGALSVSVWARRHNDETFYNATPQRAYLDEKDTTDGKDGTWKYSDSYGRTDIPVIASLMSMAFSWIVTQEQKAYEQSKT